LSRTLFLFPKRVNDKQHYRNRDARIGDVERRPGIGVTDVQIKKEKVNHVSVKQPICEISQDARKKKRERHIPPRVRASVSHQQNRHNDQCNDRNYNEESVVALERSKRRTGISDVNKVEEVRHYNPSIVRADGSQYQLFRQLVQSVERKRKEKDEPHVGIDPANAQRPTPDVQRSMENVARLSVERSAFSVER
jgi:hypothetical protein